MCPGLLGNSPGSPADCSAQTVSYCYDELHRITGRAYGALSCPLTSPAVSYAYDSGANAKGHLTQMTDQAGTAAYTYRNFIGAPFETLQSP
jgi:hypothetical protein